VCREWFNLKKSRRGVLLKDDDPKDTARIVAGSAKLRIRSALDSSQAQHDVPIDERTFLITPPSASVSMLASTRFSLKK